ncbi:MAG: 30S ribosome-binding factor RbfA [Alphaproteobacteria bacterium]|nr:30S ribosome-binding factor RbfA [Alphaproteobacteria bacterium]MCL2890124.1 30S ribosome-binding factor RbfA [Alphaproteobacteria bacterium]
MPKRPFNPSSNRGERISSTVQKIVAEILRDNYGDDPVLGRVSIVGSESASGLTFVRLYYYIGGESADVQSRLDGIAPSIRRELAHRMDQKYVPDLRFAYDDTLEKSARIDELLNSISGDL